MTEVNFTILQGIGTIPKAPCVRTPAVLAILTNLISADIFALAFQKGEGFFYEFFVRGYLFFWQKMSVES